MVVSSKPRRYILRDVRGTIRGGAAKDRTSRGRRISVSTRSYEPGK